MGEEFMTFDNITVEDLQGDNGLQLICTFANRMASSPPISRHTKKPYNTTSLQEALRTCVRKLKARFQSQIEEDICPESELATLARRVKDGYNRTMMEGDDENQLFISFFPIPLQHSERTTLIPSQDFATEEMRRASRRVDLYRMCKRLFTRFEFSSLAKLVLTYKCIGRGGEVKFLSYKRFYFCDKFNALFTQWFQRKNLKSSPSGAAVDIVCAEACPFLALGAYWACERGLMRPNSGSTHALQRKNAYVFQDLHDMYDKNVAKKLTAIVRDGVPDLVKETYTVKSLRTGAMTHLTWDAGVTYDEAVALGGWATNSNKDWYTWTYLVAIIPPMLSLAGYQYPRMMPVAPHQGSLFHQVEQSCRVTNVTWDNFVTQLFPNNLPEFVVGCRLREFMNCVASVMIMHFSYICNTYGSQHPVSDALVGACVRAGLVSDHHVGVGCLHKWSAAVTADFKARLAQSASSEEPNLVGAMSLRSELTKLNQTLAVLHSTQVASQSLVSATNARMDAIETAMQALSNSMSTMGESLQSLTIRRELTTPPTIRRELNTPPAASSPEPPAPPAAPPAAPPVQQQLRTSPQDRADRRRGASRSINEVLGPRRQTMVSRKKGETNPQECIVFVLSQMWNDKARDPLKSLRTLSGPALDDLTAWVHHKTFAGKPKTDCKIRTVLKYIDCTWTKDERALIVGKDSLPDINAATELIQQVVNRAMRNLAVLQVKNPALKNKAKTNILGLCNRIGKSVVKDKLNDYLPDWTKDGAIKKGVTLQQYVDQRIEELGLT